MGVEKGEKVKFMSTGKEYFNDEIGGTKKFKQKPKNILILEKLDI